MAGITLLGGSTTNAGGAFTAITMATGDSNTVQSHADSAPAYIEELIRGGAEDGYARVRSAKFPEPVKGFHVHTAENPLKQSGLSRLNQLAYSQDALTLELTGGGAGVNDVLGLSIYYTALAGVSARLAMPSDLAGLMLGSLTVEVAASAGATPAAWKDTVWTTTDNLLKGDTDYAVLGYMCDTTVSLVALKGQDTGTGRIGGPGSTDTLATAERFVRLSEITGRPHIPVINSSNNANTFVSVLDIGANTAVNVTFVLAQLSQNLPNLGS